jgi:hypothetical protein
MLGWNGFKYRNQVIIDIHSILFFVPELKKLLKTFPNLRRAAGEFRKEGKSELEAAVYLSLVVLASVLSLMPKDGRNEALAQLTRFENDRFRWFRDQLVFESGMPGSAIDRGATLAKAITEVLPLTFALGSAFWYLGHSVRENRLSEMAYRYFLTDVVGMLQGKSEEARRMDRFRGAVNSISG